VGGWVGAVPVARAGGGRGFGFEGAPARLLVAVDRAGHEVDLRLQQRRAVDRVGVGARGGQRRLRARLVAQRVVRLRLHLGGAVGG
jgi:hypothetical protein